MRRDGIRFRVNERGIRNLQRHLAESLNTPTERRPLTKFQRRELLWLASAADENGSPSSRDLAERNRSFAPERHADLAARYRALERAGYVDCLSFAWGDDVINVRLTEEGRDAAESILAEELESPSIPDETRSKIESALISQGIGLAASLLLKFLTIGW